MLNVGVIGVGNCGNQVCLKAHSRLGVDVLAINSSEEDLSRMPETITKILIGDSKGVGKDRLEAKMFLKPKVMQLIKSEEFIDFMDKDVVYVVSSCGGGTGSGITPMLVDILKHAFPDVNTIAIGAMPSSKESLVTQSNGLEYLKELFSIEGVTYMLYDNGKNFDTPAHMVLPVINDAIVDDIEVLMGTYQVPTDLNSIDRKDSIRLTSIAGNLRVVSRKDIREKDLDNNTVGKMLVDAMKESRHVDFQRDKVLKGLGVISNLSERISMKFDTSVPELMEFVGEPKLVDFQHTAINKDDAMLNSVFVILSGMSRPNDYIAELQERVNNMVENHKESKADDVEIDISGLSTIKEKPAKVKEEDVVNIDDILAKYGLS